MVYRGSIEETKDSEESDAEKKKKMASEYSIFSSILADIDDNPLILHKGPQVSIFPPILADTYDEESPTILQTIKMFRGSSSPKTPLDFTSTISQTLTPSDLVGMLNQELKVLKSDVETKGDGFVSRSPDCVLDYDCVKQGKTEQPEEVTFLADEVIEPISEDGDVLKNLDEMLSSMLGDEQVNNADVCGASDEFLDEMLEKIEKNGNFSGKIGRGFVFGGLLEGLLRDRLKEKAEKEIASWVTNGESQEVAEDKSEVKRDTMKKVKPERCGQESTVSKRGYFEYKRRMYLFEKLRERDENLMKRRVKAARLGAEFSFLVAEYMFLIPNELLVDAIENYLICLRGCGSNEGTSVIIGKLEEVFEIVIRKKEGVKHHRAVNYPESAFMSGDNLPLCADAVQILGKIVWSLRSSNQTDQRLEFSDLDSLFEDCQKVLMKIELKLVEMKQQIYRSVSVDYESFSKSERFDSLLRRKLMKRVNVDCRYGRAVIGPCLNEIWKSLFQAEALQVQVKEE